MDNFRYVVIGHPLGHSMSPFIHRRLFALQGREEDYGSVDIPPEELAGRLAGMLETVRGLNRTIPILFVSARDDLQAKQKGFDLGIDDYMVKPIDFSELLMRVRALLRRANIEASRRLTAGGLVLDADGLTAVLDGVEIPVTTREFNILYKLLSYPNRTFSRSHLMDEFWGVESDTGLRAVDVYITKLRDKFSACPAFEIRTVRGLGYKAVLK